jgi:ribosomal protein S18 acetylase RimI-like enzyme
MGFLAKSCSDMPPEVASLPFESQTLPFLAGRSATEARRTAIRPCSHQDLARVAKIHHAQFGAQKMLLGALSQASLAAFYKAFLDRSVFLVHADGDDVDGFVLGGWSRVLTRCKVAFFRQRALMCVANVLRRPQYCLTALRAFHGLVKGWLSLRSTDDSADEFRMLSIAVAPNAMRKGVGRALVQGFEAAAEAECRVYGLSVAKSNLTAIRFYEEAAFQYVGETPTSWKLRKELAAGAAAELRPAA